MTLRTVLPIAGWAILLLSAPLALLGAVMPANEYKSIGMDGLDCDGPFGVYLVAVPALLLYGGGLVFNIMQWRNRLNLAAAILCLAACAFLSLNITHAMWENAEQQAQC